MARNTQNKKWWVGVLTPQLFVYLMGGFIAVIIFWVRTQESWVKVKEIEKAIEEKVNFSDFKTLDDRVTRQYSVQREMNDKTNKEVDDLKLWRSYLEGYNQAIKDLSKQK